MRSYKAARRAADEASGSLPAIPFEVTYYDTAGVERTEQFACTGEVSAATISDMGYFSDLSVATPEGAAIVRKVFMEGIGDDAEFRRFWRAAARLDEDTFVEVMIGVIEDTTGRPTRLPSDSLPPSSTTGQPSRVDSLPQASSPPAMQVVSSL